MSTYDWSTEKLDSIVAWYGMKNFDPSAPAREDIVLEIDPNSAKGRILVTFQDLFDLELDPDDVAKRLAVLVLGQGKNEPETTMTAWQFMIGVIISASHFFEHDTLARLADTMVELSKLPEALPYHPIFGRHAKNVEPGDLAFTHLPGLGLSLFENLQGPRQYICHLQDVTFQARLAAQKRFKNVNTFAAMLTRIYLRGLHCKAMDHSGVFRPVVSSALDYEIPEGEYQDQSTVNYFRMGDPAILYLPAAIQWINVAGREVFQDISRRTSVVPSSTVTGFLRNHRKRWEFWRLRLLYLAEREDLGPELSNAALEAADNLAVILE